MTTGFLLGLMLIGAPHLPDPSVRLVPTAPPSKPRLVVMITVDQLLPDYLVRWRPQLAGGLKRLLDEGAVFTAAYQDHAVTETAPGHSTVLSGRWPAHTGIISNDHGVFDEGAPLVQVPDGDGASPRRFRGTAFFDWLDAADEKSRALSVSRKDRGAILPLGRAREAVYWYAAGIFTTSTYYSDSLPAWVRTFNDQRIPFRYADQPWTLLLPESAYAEPDRQPWEDPQGQFEDKSFPHLWPPDSALAARRFAVRPEIDSLTLAFALAGANALSLGRRGSTDLLAVSLSATDAIGHTFGPHSREVHDMVLRLDRYLGWFLDRLLESLGSRDVVLALTADHGVTPFPDEARAHGHPEAASVEADTLIATVNSLLGNAMGNAATAQPGTGFFFDSGMFFLRASDEAYAAGVNVDSVVVDLAARLRRLSCVARVDRPVELARADTAQDVVARRWIHQLPADAPVALVTTLKPFCVWGDGSYAMHGQPSDRDAHVPLVLWGIGVKRGTYRGRVATVDLAPTLAAMVGVTPLEPVDGRVLTEARQ